MSLVKFRDVWFKYDKDWVLRDISLDLERNEFVVLTGRNGSGKTTLAKHLNGLLKPDKGKVYVNGFSTEEKTTAELSSRVGYVFQNPDNQIFRDEVIEEVGFGPKNLNLENPKERAVSALKKVRLYKEKDRYTFSLSKGQKKRLTIASVLAMDPEILVLDEPFQGQDRNECLRMLRIFKELSEEGKVVILISHDVGMILKWTDRILILRNGSLVSKESEKLMNQNEVS